MNKIDNVISILHTTGMCREESSAQQRNVSTISILIISLIYLAAILSVNLYSPQILVWLAIYPVVASEYFGIGYGKVFLKSLWVLPVVIFISIFNVIYDRNPGVEIGNLHITLGWISFISILLRGLLSIQCVIILITTCGFYQICNALYKLKVPKILVTQLILSYRYMIVILEETQSMSRARISRGFGKTNYPLKLWSVMIGQLMIRSFERATRIHQAMLSRGFNGNIMIKRENTSTIRSMSYILLWGSVILFVRFFDISSYFCTYF